MQDKNTVDNLINKSKSFFLDLLFPRFCLGCKKEGFYLCEDCRALLDILEYNYCLCDYKPQRLLPEQKTGKCNHCQNKRLSGLYFALSYKEKALTRKLIHQFKYPPYLKDLAKTLAGILAEHFIISGKNISRIWENSVLLPVPLDYKKLKIRGYNQSEEIAKELSKILKIPALSGVLVKIKPTKPQMELLKKERENNLCGAFAVKNSEQFLNKKIFLVDDVYTTGSTMEECALVLQNEGVKNIWGIALAREE